MDEDQNTGVEVQAEGETAVSSPADEQTPQDDSAEAATEAEEVEGKTDKAIPYSRFKEVNDKARQYEERLKELEAKFNNEAQPRQELDPQAEQVKQTLKQYGFVSKEDVDAELKRLREDSALEQRLSRLESSYNGKDGRPKFSRSDVVQFAIDNQIADPEAAYKIMHEKELTDWHVARALGKSTGVKAEKSDGSGSSGPGPSNKELEERAIQGDSEARDVLLGRTKVFQKFFGG